HIIFHHLHLHLLLPIEKQGIDLIFYKFMCSTEHFLIQGFIMKLNVSASVEYAFMTNVTAKLESLIAGIHHLIVYHELQRSRLFNRIKGRKPRKALPHEIHFFRQFILLTA